MNNKNSKKQSSFMKENGFLIALYSLVGVLVVVAISITILMPSKGKNGLVKNPEENDSVVVDSSLVKTYTEQGKESDLGEIGEAVNEANVQKQSKSTVPTQTKDNAETNKKESVPTKSDAPSTLEESKALNGTTNEEPDATATTNEEPTESKNKKENDSYEDEDDEDSSSSANDDYESPKLRISVQKETTFSFDDAEKMTWPVAGDIVMNYSTEKMVYDKTLEQYRTNDNIAIAAPVGTEVMAAADGKVTEVGKTVEDGNYIIIDHGNGYKTFYSQLDGISVDKSDNVTKGHIIGVVAKPTRHSVLLGDHLTFKLTKEDVPISPLAYLN